MTNYKINISDARWMAYDIPGNIGWIAYLVCLFKGKNRSPFRTVLEAIPGVLMIIGVVELISERIARLDRVLSKVRLYRGFGALTLGGLLGMAVSTPGIVKKEKRSAVMFCGGVLCSLFAGLLFVGYKKD